MRTCLCLFVLFKVRRQAQKDLSAFMETAGSSLWHHLASIDTSELPETRHRLNDVLKLLGGDTKLTLVDAFKRPIPNAVVSVYRRGEHPFYHQKDAVFLGRTFSNALGVFRVPGDADELGPRLIPLLKEDFGDGPIIDDLFGAGGEAKIQFEVYAPSYGAAGVRWPPVRPRQKRGSREGGVGNDKGRCR